MDRRLDIVDAFRTQIDRCTRLGSPFTARLLESLLLEYGNGRGLDGLIGDWGGNPVDDALALRLAGALRALVIQGASPGLAALFPPRLPDTAELHTAVVEAIDQHAGTIARILTSPPQTNEARRSAVLLGGFLHVAEVTGLPLRCLELGASAGLNQVWDRFRYDLGGGIGWGDAGSPVRITSDWQGECPPLHADVKVLARAACDRSPVDLTRDDQRTMLRAYVWADQTGRLAVLDAAMGLAVEAGVTVEAGDAADWLERQLSRTVAGCATVVYHSIFWRYLPAETQARIVAALERAGLAASATSPLAWLSFELPEGGPDAEVHLTLWPGGQRRRIGTAHPHGAWVRWH